ncbi:MAG: FHA domain-containing protein [Lapillicoccus sp.]
MSELTYTIVRLGLLALLWVFVLSLAAVLRRDLYGTRVSHRSRADRRAGARPVTPAPAPRAPVAAAAGAGAAAAPRQPRRRRPPTTLVVTDGQMAGTSLPLGRQGVVVGRNPECTLVIDDEFASGRHLRIFPRAEGWFVEDLGSRNGTVVGGAKITGAVPVESGSVVKVGRTTLELRD